MKPESFHIDTSGQYQQVKKTISRQQQPGKVMRFLMNALESYRQSRKLGWSRPWNKYHLNVFQSFKLNAERDDKIIEIARKLLHDKIPMPSSAKRFVDDLLSDNSKLMGYVFVHDYQDPDDNQRYEGVTLSLGRIKDKKFRDRIDLIFESPIVNGVSQGISRVRVFVDPYMGVKEPLWCSVLKLPLDNEIYNSFELLSQCSWDWAVDSDKLWNHWTENYIDYFGERKNAPEQSYFYTAGNVTVRIEKKAQRAA